MRMAEVVAEPAAELKLHHRGKSLFRGPGAASFPILWRRRPVPGSRIDQRESSNSLGIGRSKCLSHAAAHRASGDNRGRPAAGIEQRREIVGKKLHAIGTGPPFGLPMPAAIVNKNSPDSGKLG